MGRHRFGQDTGRPAPPRSPSVPALRLRHPEEIGPACRRCPKSGVPPPARRGELAGLRNRSPCPTKPGRCYQEMPYTTSQAGNNLPRQISCPVLGPESSPPKTSKHRNDKCWEASQRDCSTKRIDSENNSVER